MKRYLALLKMVEDNLVSFDFDSPQPDSKRQKLLECVLTRNGKLYLGKVYTEERVNKRTMKKWINVLIIMKLSSQIRC